MRPRLQGQDWPARVRGNHALAVVFATLSFSCLAADFTGQVVSVQDGDTLTALVGRTQFKIRLAEIDAPELRQAFGQRSRDSLAALCFHKQARLEPVDRDRYGRTVARVECDGVDANREQVRRGMAWVYLKYSSPSSALHSVQSEAQSARSGLWSEPGAVPPWDWRKSTK